jgi:hypothetical protein
MGGGERMKRILKQIDRKIKGLVCAEVHERFDGNHKEADRLCEKIRRLENYRELIKELEK